MDFIDEPEDSKDKTNGHHEDPAIANWLLEQIKSKGRDALRDEGALAFMGDVYKADPLGKWLDLEAAMKEAKIDLSAVRRQVKESLRAQDQQAAKEESARRRAEKDEQRQAERQQAQLEKLRAKQSKVDAPPERYSIDAGQICFEGEPITNFTARISADIEFDDQLEPRREYEIVARIAGDTRDRTSRIRAEEFAESSKWIEKAIGAKARVSPKRGEYVREAIKIASKDCDEKRIIAHTGWRNDGNGWKFYHAGGATGADGLEKCDVEMVDGLQMYELPELQKEELLKEAWAAFEQLLNVHKPEIVAPLLGAVLCAPVDRPRFSVFSIGQTGYGKTTYNLLFLSMFGRVFVAEEKAPADWEGTLFGHQVRAHRAQNIPLLIDEYLTKPGPQGDKARHICAEMLRSQGNLSGRTAGNVHGGLRKERYPRGLIMATGEDVPDGRSLRARCVVVEFTEKMNEASKQKLTECQQHARGGLYAALGGAFIQWLAMEDRIEHFLNSRQSRIQELRIDWAEHMTGARVHERTPTNLASLARAWEIFLQFAREMGFIDQERSDEIRELMENGLKIVGAAQAPWLTDSEVHTKFLHLVAVALSSGTAHLEPAPDYAFVSDELQVLGWRARDVTTRGEVEGEASLQWTPQGTLIGWADERNVYLMPAAARKAADSLIPACRSSQSLSQRQFDALLVNAGLVVGDGRKLATKRKKIGAAQVDVYFFTRETILGKSTDETGDIEP